MEINRFEDVIGLVTQADTVEGRFVIMVANAMGGLFMNTDTDLPGCRVPATPDEATRAKFCLTWAVDNRKSPLVFSYPHPVWDERGGWVNSPAGPVAVTMWLTHPGNQNSQTIPSGTKALGYTEGTFTLPSGQYVDSVAIRVPGAAIVIADVATDGAVDAGKPKVSASGVYGVIGYTEVWDSNDASLTIRVE